MSQRKHRADQLYNLFREVTHTVLVPTDINGWIAAARADKFDCKPWTIEDIAGLVMQRLVRECRAEKRGTSWRGVVDRGRSGGRYAHNEMITELNKERKFPGNG